jgi:hypothetical protein
MTALTPLDLVKLPHLMELTEGRSDMIVGLIDGPVAVGHSDLAGANMREVPGGGRGACTKATSSRSTSSQTPAFTRQISVVLQYAPAAGISAADN